MADGTHLFGSCSCERNTYIVRVDPQASQVFFDNSSTYRRAQAAPVTAFLRVPLDNYESTTTAFFADETPATIKRVYHTPAPAPAQHQTRRQFCAVCGTTLTAWEEGNGEADYISITLGSLHEESLARLEALNLLPDSDSGSDEEVATGKDGHASKAFALPASTANLSFMSPSRTTSRMANRGLPYFEDMVEHSRLGRIRRQAGGHTSQDGRMTVQWEVIEIDDSDDVSSPDSKRLKLDS